MITGFSAIITRFDIGEMSSELGITSKKTSLFISDGIAKGIMNADITPSGFRKKLIQELGTKVLEDHPEFNTEFMVVNRTTTNFNEYNGRDLLRIPVEFVDGSNRLNIDALRNWRDDFSNALFLTENGNFIVHREIEKMSKRWHNVVNPDDIVEKFGADVLRMYEMFLGPIEQSKPWNTQGISGVSNFLRKLWRLFHSNENVANSEEAPNEKELKTLHTCIRKVNEDIEAFSFNTSVSAFMICVNELTEMGCNKRQILEPLTVLLAPFAPHSAEELWAKLGHAPSVTQAPYPAFNPEFLTESTKDYPVSFNGKVRFTLSLPATMLAPEVEKAALADERTTKFLEGKTIKKIIVVPGKIVNVVLG
jgi:leucyl-tRNA synthetase